LNRVLLFLSLFFVLSLTTIYLLPISGLISYFDKNNDISYNSAEGNVIAGKINLLKYKSLIIDEVSYSNNFSLSGVKSSMKLNGAVQGEGIIKYRYDNNFFEISDSNFNFVFNNNIIGKIIMNIKTVSEIKINHLSCLSGRAIGTIKNPLNDELVKINLECLNDQITIYQTLGRDKINLGRIETNDTNVKLILALDNLIQDLPFYLKDEIELKLFR